jgi:hypothetical protein
MDSSNGGIRMIGVILGSQNQYCRSKEKRSRNEGAGMEQPGQVQEDRPPGYIFYTSSGSSSDSGVKGKVEVQ